MKRTSPLSARVPVRFLQWWLLSPLRQWLGTRLPLRFAETAPWWDIPARPGRTRRRAHSIPAVLQLETRESPTSLMDQALDASGMALVRPPDDSEVPYRRGEDTFQTYQINTFTRLPAGTLLDHGATMAPTQTGPLEAAGQTPVDQVFAENFAAPLSAEALFQDLFGRGDAAAADGILPLSIDHKVGTRGGGLEGGGVGAVHGSTSPLTGLGGDSTGPGPTGDNLQSFDQALLEAMAGSSIIGRSTAAGPPPAPAATPGPAARPARLDRDFGRLPLLFEPNWGQVGAGPQVQFLARGQGHTLFLTSGGDAVLGLARPNLVGSSLLPTPVVRDLIRLRFAGASPSGPAQGQELLESRSNYFTGGDPHGWKTDIPNYARVHQSLYPGVEVTWYGTSQRQLEYDLIVAPGTSVGVIQLEFQGHQFLRLDPSGNLILVSASGGELVHRRPVIYQPQGSERLPVTGRYVLQGPDRVGFQVDAYDSSRPLIIDPVLDYSSYLGGSNTEFGYGIATDPSGHTFISGQTESADLPVVDPLLGSYAGQVDAFVTKLDRTGTRVLFILHAAKNEAGSNV